MVLKRLDILDLVLERAQLRGHAPELSETLGIPYGPGKVAVLPRETRMAIASTWAI